MKTVFKNASELTVNIRFEVDNGYNSHVEYEFERGIYEGTKL